MAAHRYFPVQSCVDEPPISAAFVVEGIHMAAQNIDGYEVVLLAEQSGAVILIVVEFELCESDHTEESGGLKRIYVPPSVRMSWNLSKLRTRARALLRKRHRSRYRL